MPLDQTKNCDYLVGDVVVLTTFDILCITELLTLIDFDGEFWITDHHIGRVKESVIRLATPSELLMKRRLTNVEQALAEVS